MIATPFLPPRLQAPPASEPVKVEGVTTFELCKNVHLVRGCARERIKYEVEYGLKRGGWCR